MLFLFLKKTVNRINKVLNLVLLPVRNIGYKQKVLDFKKTQFSINKTTTFTIDEDVNVERKQDTRVKTPARHNATTENGSFSANTETAAVFELGDNTDNMFMLIRGHLDMPSSSHE